MTTIAERVFLELNANPNVSINELSGDDNPATVSATRTFWRKTRHKVYRSASSIEHPVETARKIIKDAAYAGLEEAEGRDLAIDAGVAHGTAFSVAAQEYRDFRQWKPALTGSRGTWTVTTPTGMELPVCHNIRVDWAADMPIYADTFKNKGKKYARWLRAFENGYAVIQKGKIVDGVETRARDRYMGIYRIDHLSETTNPDDHTANVFFRMVARLEDVPTSPWNGAPKGQSPVTQLPSLWDALLTIACTAERTALASGKERKTVSKWKEFGFTNPEEMANHLETLFAAQEGKCALTGIPMTTEPGDWCVSPDRIDSNSHYKGGNIQLVARCVNFMKGGTPNAVFKSQLAFILKNST